MSEGNWVPKMARLIDELLKRGAYKKTNALVIEPQKRGKGPAMSDSESDDDDDDEAEVEDENDQETNDREEDAVS
jgi:hypothetical protein